MSHTILVVEDDADSLFLYELFLQDLGVDVVGAESIPVALKHLAAGLKPSLILLDYNLGRGHAGQFLTQLRARADAIPPRILLLSGEDGLAAKAQSLEADAFLRKPIDLDMFIVLVKDLLARPYEPMPKVRIETQAAPPS